MKKTYIKPSVKIKKVKVGLFFTNRRYMSSFNSLLDVSVMAQSATCNGGCFLSGTKVLMANGSLKDIERVKEGDRVMSMNIENSDLIPNSVKATKIVDMYDNGYILLNNKIKVTPNHRIFIGNGDWKRADELSVGNVLIDNNGERIEIDSILKIKTKPRVYNLSLNGKEHNFFANGVLVHNGLELLASSSS